MHVHVCVWDVVVCVCVYGMCSFFYAFFLLFFFCCCVFALRFAFAFALLFAAATVWGLLALFHVSRI